MIDKEIIESMNESIKQFEKDLKVPNGFYANLVYEDDWSFVIKLSALLETASTDALTTVLGYNEIETSLSYLDYGNVNSGKIVLMEKLDLISKNQVKTLRELLKIRNKIAHKLENINFTFDEYVKGFDSNQKKSFVNDFGHSIVDSFKLEDKKINKKNFVLENPKNIIWFTVREIIACIYLSKEKKEIQKKLTIEIIPNTIKIIK